MMSHERTIWLIGLACWGAMYAASFGQEAPPTAPGTPPLAKPTTFGPQATPLEPAAAAPQLPPVPTAQPGLPGPAGLPLPPPGIGGGGAPMIPGTGPFPAFVDPLAGPPNTPPLKVGDMSLEQLLQNALRGHAEILSAQSKVRDAEIDLIRVKQKILVQIATKRAEYEVAKALYADAKTSHERTTKLLATKAISMEEARLAESALVKAKAEMTRAEAALSGAAAITPAGYGDAFSRLELGVAPHVWSTLDTDRSRAALERWVGARGALGEAATAPGGSASKAVKDMLKLLATKVSLQGGEVVQLGEVVDQLHKQTPLRFVFAIEEYDARQGKQVLRTDGAMPLGALLQWIEDAFQVKCVIRDYGIMLIEPGRVPAGSAIYLMDIWRQSDLSLLGSAPPGPSGTSILPTPNSPPKSKSK